MSSQIDSILYLTERGWYPFTGKVAPEVYKALACPAPLFAKWLYEGKEGLEVACVGCDRLCRTSELEGFSPSPRRLKTVYRGSYGYYTLWPAEMVKRLSLLSVSQAAYCLHISERTVYDYIATGKLLALKDRPIRVKSADVAALMNTFDE